MTVASGIINILVGAGVGSLAPGGVWPIYEAQLPDDVAQCLMVRTTGGPRPEVKVAIDYPSVQVLARSGPQGYLATAQKVEEVALALHAIDSAPATYSELTSCILAGQPTFLGYDANKLPIWSCNFNCIISKNPEGYRDL